MSAPPQVVLLDSNAYFRLAQSIHPLLGQIFGPPPPFSLFVLEVLDREFASNRRLQNKFEWVNQKVYKEDRRRNTYEVKGSDWVAKVETAYSFFAGYVRMNKLSASPEDIRALAIGRVKQFPVVSDDRDIRDLAAMFNVTCWWSLDLLKLMQNHSRIGRGEVIQTVEYWNEQNDLPRKKDDFRIQYKAVFGDDSPI
ncbi:MAG: hypothetical protein WCK89_10010 [bacterium]